MDHASPPHASSPASRVPARDAAPPPLARVLHRLDGAIGAACRGVLYLTMSVVFVILSANVGLRYAAGTSLSWASELPELMFPWLIMAGVVLAAQHSSHIAVVILTQRFPETLRRWVLSFGSLIVVGMYAYLVVQAWPLMEIAHDEKTPIMQVPGSVTVWALMLGFSLLSVVVLSRLYGLWHPEHDSAGGHS